MRRLLGLAVALAALALVAAPALAKPGRSEIKGYLLASPNVIASVKATIRETRYGGGIDRVVYGDLTGDGTPETVVTVFSGGTAGDIAFYVLTGEGSGLHALKYANREYKVGVAIVKGKLQVTRPVYAKNDPNCCPQHLEITTYRWTGAKLVSASRRLIKTPR
jgi:hypothetical protein